MPRTLTPSSLASIEGLRAVPVRLSEAENRFEVRMGRLRTRYLPSDSRTPVSQRDRQDFERDALDVMHEYEQEIASITRSAESLNAAAERDVTRRSGLDHNRPTDAEIDRAWSRTKAALDGGVALDTVRALPGFGRAEVEALRREWPSYAASKAPGIVGTPKFDAAIADVMNGLSVIEIEVAEPDVVEALEWAVDRRRAAEAVRIARDAVLRHVATLKEQEPATWRGRESADLIRDGFAVGQALAVGADQPGRQTFSEIAAMIDSEAAAKRSLNSAPPEVRQALVENAKDVSWGQPMRPMRHPVGGRR